MIVCIGEALIDRKGDERLIGGGPYNTAIACARLGSCVSYCGRISSDEEGSLILDNLVDNCVLFDPSLCADKGYTMYSNAVMDEKGSASYEFVWEGSSAASLTEKDLLDNFEISSDVELVFYGSVSLVMPPGCDAIADLVKSRNNDAVLFLDPNVRPAMIADRNAYSLRIRELMGKSHLVKLSDEDLDFIYFFEPDPPKRISLALEDCRCNLIVTHGEHGSTWFRKDLCIDCPAQVCNDFVDTIGCGDVFDGALMTYLVRNGLVGSVCNLDAHEIEDALSFASRAAMLNCTRPGCQPPYIEEM